MKVHELITILARCPAGSDVQIASGPMVAEDICDVEIPGTPEETCFLFGGPDPEIMNEDSEVIGNLSELIASHEARN